VLYVVEKVPNICGNTSFPKSSKVISGFVIFNGMIYSSFSSSSIFCASSIVTPRSTPFTCGYIFNGFCSIDAFLGSFFISLHMSSIFISFGFVCFTGIIISLFSSFFAICFI